MKTLEDHLFDLLSEQDNPSLEEVVLLIQNCIDINHIFEDEFTIIGQAVGLNRLDIVKELVRFGSDINRIQLLPSVYSGGEMYNNGYLSSVAENAAFMGFQEIFDFVAPLTKILERRDATGNLPCGICERADFEYWQTSPNLSPITRILERRYETRSPLPFYTVFEKEQITSFRIAFREGFATSYLKIVQSVIASSKNINQIGDNGCTLLWTAAHNGQLASVSALIEAGVELDIPNQTDGWTSLMIAAATHEIWSVGTQKFWHESRSNQLEVVKLMLERGSDVNAKSLSGRTPLMEVISSGINQNHLLVFAAPKLWCQNQDRLMEMVQLLVEAGADVNATSYSGKTALMEAVLIGRADVIEILLDASADTAIVDDFGDSAVSIAEAAGYDELARKIRES